MPKKIIIIDDELDICDMVTEFLTDAGYTAFYALTGPDGLALIKKENPNLVLLDIGIPGMNGIEVMREIHEQYPLLAVIVLSGQKDIETVKKMISYGACEYLTKPIHLETLYHQFVRDLIGPP